MGEPGGTWRRSGVKLDEAQASARRCAGRPDFGPCDGGAQSACTTHSHGRCFKLHWCCLLGWCHCKYVYLPMTSVLQLPSTPIPSGPGDHAPSLSLSALLAERFLRTASCLASPTSDLGASARPSTEDYTVTRVNGRAFYVSLARRSEAPGTGTPRCGAPLRHRLRSRTVLSYGSTPLHGDTQAPRQVLDQGSVGRKSRRGFAPSDPEDSGVPGVDRSSEAVELNEEPTEQLSRGLNEDLNEGYNEGQWDLPLLPVLGSLQGLAEALETTV